MASSKEGDGSGRSNSSKRRSTNPGSRVSNHISRPMKDSVRLRLISELVQICADHSILELCARDTDLNCDYEASLSSAYTPTTDPESVTGASIRRTSSQLGSPTTKSGAHPAETAHVIVTHRLAYLPGMLLAFHHKRAPVSKSGLASGGRGSYDTPLSSSFVSPSLSAIYNRPSERERAGGQRQGSKGDLAKAQEEVRFYGHHDVHLLPTAPLFNLEDDKEIKKEKEGEKEEERGGP